MASSGPPKRIWTEYTKLKLWTTSPDAASKRFSVEISSFEDPTITPLSESNNSGGASAIPVQCVTIIGLIYPATEPFIQRGLRMEMRVPFTYPQEPPEVYMKTNIRHPNIEKNRRICSALLDQTKTWQRGSLVDVVNIVIHLIDQPEQGHVVDGEMGSLFDMNRAEYNRKIMEMVTRDGVPRA